MTYLKMIFFSFLLLLLVNSSLFSVGPGNGILIENKRTIFFEDKTVGKTVLGNGIVNKMLYSNQYFIVGTTIGIELYNKSSLSFRKRLVTKGSVIGFDISPDQRYIAYGGSAKKVKVWDLKTNEVISLGHHKGAINAVIFSPDGKKVISGSDDKTIRIWDTQAKKKRKSRNIRGNILKYHKGAVTSLDISHNGILLASASKDNSVYLYSFKDRRARLAYNHDGEVNQVIFGPRNKFIASCGNDNKVIIWSLSTAKARIMGQHLEWVTSIAVTPDKKTFLSASLDGTVISWDLKTDLRDILLETEMGINSLVISPAGDRFAFNVTDSDIKVAKVKSGLVNTTFRGHDSWVNSISVARGGSVIASAYSNGVVKLWNLNRKSVKTKKLHNGMTYQVALSPNGKKIASCGSDNRVKVWNVATNKIQTMKEHTTEVYSVAYSPNQDIVASGSTDKVVLWEVSENDTHAIDNIKGSIYALSFGPKNKYLAIGTSDGIIYLYNLREKKLTKLGKLNQAATSLHFNSNETRLASGSKNGSVSVWNIRTKTVNTNKPHKGGVNAISFSPDDDYVASGGVDGKVITWDLQNEKTWLSNKHSDSVTGLFFIPKNEPGQSDNFMIVSSSYDGSVKISPMLPPKPKKKIRKNLDIDEKKSKQVNKRLTKTIYKRFVWEREIWKLKLREGSLSNAVLYKNYLVVSTLKGKVYAIGLGSKVSEELEEFPEKGKIPSSLTGRLRYDEIDELLILDGVMSKQDKNKLLTMSKDRQYKRVINKLYKKSRLNYGVLWSFKAIGKIDSTPVIKDGTVYFGTSRQYFYALNVKTGKSRWTKKNKQGKIVIRKTKVGPIGLNSSPVITKKTIYIGSVNGILYALKRKSGKIRWKYKVGGGIFSTPTVHKNMILIGSENGYLYALKENRKQRKKDRKTKKRVELIWKKEPGPFRIIGTKPIIYKDLVVIGNHGGDLVAYDLSNGEKNWSLKTGKIQSPPQRYNNFLFLSTAEGEVLKIDLKDNGKVLWKIKIAGNNPKLIVDQKITIYKTIPFVSSNAKAKKPITERKSAIEIYLSHSNKEIVALNFNTGQQVWVYNKLGIIPGLLAAGDPEYLYAINRNGNVYKLRKDIYEYIGQEFPLDTSEKLGEDPTLLTKGKLEEYEEYEDFAETGNESKDTQHDVYDDYSEEKEK